MRSVRTKLAIEQSCQENRYGVGGDICKGEVAAEDELPCEGAAKGVHDGRVVELEALHRDGEREGEECRLRETQAWEQRCEQPVDLRRPCCGADVLDEEVGDVREVVAEEDADGYG